MMRSRCSLLLVAAWCLACESGEKSAVIPPQGSGIASAAAAAPEGYDIEITNGQSVYVPVYSHIYYSVDKKQLMATMLSIRNTDPKHSITLRDVDYFDSEGTVLQSYLEQPMVLGPMASTEFVVDSTDTRGGAGANFVVNWDAEEEVFEPVVESVMVGTAGHGKLAFTSQGQVYEK
jgi:hypothetical protein